MCNCTTGRGCAGHTDTTRAQIYLMRSLCSSSSFVFFSHALVFVDNGDKGWHKALILPQQGQPDSTELNMINFAAGDITTMAVLSDNRPPVSLVIVLDLFLWYLAGYSHNSSFVLLVWDVIWILNEKLSRVTRQRMMKWGDITLIHDDVVLAMLSVNFNDQR